MINKFEAVGIFASIACMVLALFLLRVESAPERIEGSVTGQAAAVVVATDGQSANGAVAQALHESVDQNGVLEKLVIDDVVIGTGEAVKEGDTVEVHYIGTLQNGQQFDNSHKRGQAFTFTVGEGRVIAGWEQGLLGMQAGGERILVIPSDLAYGSRNVGPIPANSTLIFAIELLKIN
jgi:FKBP-type peptidyl-prolyl cis-trans isomerase